MLSFENVNFCVIMQYLLYCYAYAVARLNFNNFVRVMTATQTEEQKYWIPVQ